MHATQNRSPYLFAATSDHAATTSVNFKLVTGQKKIEKKNFEKKKEKRQGSLEKC